MQLNKTMYIDLVDPLPKSYAPKKGEEMNRSTYSTIRYREFRNSVFNEIVLVLRDSVKRLLEFQRDSF